MKQFELPNLEQTLISLKNSFMNNSPDNPAGLPASRWRMRVITFLLIAGFAGFVWNLLPDGGYSTDLSKIGTGRPTLVLAHDSNYTGGITTMALMNEIRHEYAERVDFLVAHLAMAEGQDFARRHGARDGVVLLFSEDGKNVNTLNQPQSVDELRRALNKAFSL